MHGIFLNSDVVETILDVVEDRSLASLTYTCKAFSEPAMDRIWRTMRQLKPLFRCFPSDVWAEGGDERMMGC